MNIEDEGQPIQKRLGMWDAVSIIIGIVIGVAIFETPNLIMEKVTSPHLGMFAWVLGGFLSFIGALCYAELASTYPRSGGDYYFLTRAFGSWVGFLFGWAQLVVILTGSIGAMGFVFGKYAVAVWKPAGTIADVPAVVKPLGEEQKKLLEKLKESGPRATPSQLKALGELTPEQYELVPGGRGLDPEQLEILKSFTPDQLNGLKQLKLLAELKQPARKATAEQLQALDALSPEHREVLQSRRPPGTGLEPEQLSVWRSFTTEQLDSLRKEKEAERAREHWTALLAISAVLVLTLLNILGVVLGKWTQNLLSLAKVLGLVAIAVVAFMYGKEDVWQYTPLEGKAAEGVSFGLAMVFVLYAFGGWNDSAFVAAEVRKPRNIVGALLIGISIITIVYLVVNFAYLRGLGFDKMRGSFTVAADVVQVGLKDGTFREQLGKVNLADPGKVVSILVMVSALGAINGLIFTGSRVYSSLGVNHSLFAMLGRWSPMLGSPIYALLVQALICVLMIVGVGAQLGRDAIDWCVTQLSVSSMPWAKYFGGFDTLVSGTAPVFWGFFLLSGLSLFALRQRDPRIQRPFEVPFYPLVPLIFCGTCAYMLYSALDYAKWIALIGAVPLALGVPLYWISGERSHISD